MRKRLKRMEEEYYTEMEREERNEIKGEKELSQAKKKRRKKKRNE